MSDWLIEEGIAEHRAARFEGDRIVEARVARPDCLAPGWVVEAKLIARAAGSTRGTALVDTGEEVLVDRLPASAAKGAALRLAIHRAARGGPGRLKRAQGRPSAAALARPTLAERLAATTAGSAATVKRVRRFPGTDWDDLIDEALAGEIAFAGGALIIAPTAAMTTVDIDGAMPARALALAAVAPLAAALRRFDLRGSVVVDFPTVQDKTGRRSVDDALASALSDWPHECTAMNGFGLVQIVSRLEGPSLFELAAWQRPALIWHRLLRRAEALEAPGTIALSIHPALSHAATPADIAALERRTGRHVKVDTVATLARDAPHVQVNAA